MVDEEDENEDTEATKDSVVTDLRKAESVPIAQEESSELEVKGSSKFYVNEQYHKDESAPE